MRAFAQVIGGIVACSMFFLASVCSAQLSDLEQRTLHKEAAKLAEEIGVSEGQMYQNLALLYLAKQAQGIAQKTDNPVETEHQNLRAGLYESIANALLKTAHLEQKGKRLITDLQKEQETTGGKVVSPKLSSRLNAFGSVVLDALLTVAKMSSQMVELASFEAAQGCGTRKIGYVVHCLEELQRAVRQIEAAMNVLEQAGKLFIDAAILGGMKKFTY